VSLSECHRVARGNFWRTSALECALVVGSQLSAHALCILAALSNAAIGGVSIGITHDFLSALLLGTAIYAVSISLRILWRRDGPMPSMKMSLLGLALGVAVAGGLDKAATDRHRQDVTSWYSRLSDADRQRIRGKVRQWIGRQGVIQRASLEETAQLMGYDFAEDYIILNYCSPSNKDLTELWKSEGGFGEPQL